MNFLTRKITIFVLAWMVVFSASPSQAVQVATWHQASEADFAAGQCKAVAITSRGELLLSRQVQLLMTSQTAPAVVSCIAVGDDAIYAGSGSDNAIYRIDTAGSAKEPAKFAQAPGTVVTSLLWTSDGLLAGSGGDKAGIYKIDSAGKASLLWTDEKVKYVWAMLPGPDGVIYAATGPEAGLYAVTADGKGELIYQLEAKLARNILCLAKSKDGNVLIGTDVSGLVVEVDVKNKTGYVLLDANEKEISALIVRDDGDIYAATADAGRSVPGGIMPKNGLNVGKSETAPASPTTTSQPISPSTAASTKSVGKDTPDITAEGGEGDDNCDSEDEDGEEGDPSEDSGTGEDEPATASAPSAESAGLVLPLTLGTIESTVSPETASQEGNGVYHIHKDGLVSVIFRRPTMLLAMVMRDGKLVLAAGNGAIYEASLDGDEVVQLVKTEALKVTALALDQAGRIIFATANKGSVAAIGTQLEKEGTFTSKVLDAKQISKWGTMQLASKLPSGTTVMVSTRSGNVAEPSDKTWGLWSKETPVQDDDFMTIACPAGRFLQYRLKFNSDNQISPCVRGISILYQVGNLAPQVQAVLVTTGPLDGQQAVGHMPKMPGAVGGENEVKAKFMRHITIKAQDANGDQMIYSIFFRQAGSENWIKLTDKLTEPQYQWDTRTVSDGQYELRVQASDSPSNPPESAMTNARISQLVQVDNTPPLIKDLVVKPEGMKATATGTASDASRIATIQYSVDSQDEWTAVLPIDGIFDSNKEDFSFQSKDLKPGPHRIAVKVEDIYGNVAYGTVNITIGK
jgi:hypothetical protein